MSDSLVKVLQKTLTGLGALIFLFGDVVLREFCHFSFVRSLLLWGGALVVTAVCSILLSKFDTL
jgi:hypothetical protein